MPVHPGHKYQFRKLRTRLPNLQDSSVQLLADYLNLTLKFKEYVPKCVISEIEDLLNPENEYELRNFGKLNSALQSGEINVTMPLTKEELLDVLEKYAPELYNRTVRIFEDFEEKYNQIFYSMHESSKNTTAAERISSFIKFMQEEDDRYYNSSLAIKVEYFKQFPEVLKFMKSPLYVQLRNIVNNVETSKLAGVIEKFFQILKRSFD